MQIEQNSDTLCLAADEHEWLFIADSRTPEERAAGYKYAYKSIRFRKAEFGKGKKGLLIVTYGDQTVSKELDFKAIGCPCSNSYEIFFFHPETSGESKRLSLGVTLNGTKIDLTQTALVTKLNEFLSDFIREES